MGESQLQSALLWMRRFVSVSSHRAKLPLAFGALLIPICPIEAQSQFDLFRVSIDSTGALPSTSNDIQGLGSFELYPDLRLTGEADIAYATGGDSVQLFRSSSSDQLGTLVATMEPFLLIPPPPGAGYPYGFIFNIDVHLTPSQAADLESGNLWLNIANAEFPFSAARGQLLAVPEPGTLALLFLGSGLIGMALRKRNSSMASEGRAD